MSYLLLLVTLVGMGALTQASISSFQEVPARETGASACAERASKFGLNSAEHHLCLAEEAYERHNWRKRGEPLNDAYLGAALEHYRKAAALAHDPAVKRQALSRLASIQHLAPEIVDSDEIERMLRELLAQGLLESENYFLLSSFLEDNRRLEEAESILLSAQRATQSTSAVLARLGGFYNRQGDFQKAAKAFEDRTRQDPSDPVAHYSLGTFYWEKAYKDFRLSDADKRSFIERGLGAVNRALALKPDYLEALVSKNLLLRLQATLESDPARQQALIAEADELRERAKELQRQKALSGPAAAGAVRVGGNVKPPSKIRDVKPIYPLEAQEARIQGVVIIEATIDSNGIVSDARILRSIPLLDESALTAVRQWEFTPTFLDGSAVPVIMTVTVNFTLQ